MQRLGAMIFIDSGSGAPTELIVKDPFGYWNPGGATTLSASNEPTFIRLLPGVLMTFKCDNPRFWFDGTLPTGTCRPMGMAISGVCNYLIRDYTYRNDMGSTSAANRRGAIVFNADVGSTPATTGTIDGLRIEAYANDSTAIGIVFQSGATINASHRHNWRNLDFSQLPSGGKEISIITATDAAYIRTDQVTYKNSDVRATPSALTGLTTVVGKQIGTPYQVMAAFTQGSGSGITLIELSTDGGTTYTTVLSQSSGAMPVGADLMVGPLWGDALIRVTFSTTQPTITLVPV
jgi:hypothetical protein